VADRTPLTDTLIGLLFPAAAGNLVRPSCACAGVDQRLNRAPVWLIATTIGATIVVIARIGRKFFNHEQRTSRNPAPERSRSLRGDPHGLCAWFVFCRT